MVDKGALRLTTALHAIERSIQAKGIEPDIKVLEVPADLKARADVEGGASLRSLKGGRSAEETGSSRVYVPPEERGRSPTQGSARRSSSRHHYGRSLPAEPESCCSLSEGRKGAAEATLIINEAQRRQKLNQRRDHAGQILRPESRFPSRCQNKGLAHKRIGSWSGPDVGSFRCA